MYSGRAQQIGSNDRIQAAVSTQQDTGNGCSELLPPNLFARSDTNGNDLVRLGSDREEGSACVSSIVRKTTNQWIDARPDSPALCIDSRITRASTWNRNLNDQ